MPLYDNQCHQCDYIYEAVAKCDENVLCCPICGGESRRVYLSMRGIKHSHPDYLKEVLEVVDKEGASHCQKFLKYPTRANYKSWMKGENIRHIDPGEKLIKPERDKDKIARKLVNKLKQRESIQIGGI